MTHRIAKVFLFLIIGAVLIAGMLGCGSPATQTAATSPAATSPATTTAATTAAATTTAATAATTAAATTAAPQATTRIITDMGGRTVEIPLEINRVICLEPTPTYMTWRLAPDMLVSLNTVSKKHLAANNYLFPASAMETLNNLPVTEVFFNALDMENMLSLEPDVIVSVTKDSNIDKTQETLGIPVVATKRVTFEEFQTCFRFMGELLGNEEEGNQLADYLRDLTARVIEETSQIPEGERLKVYCSSHEGPLSTVGSETIMSSIIKMAGGINVSDETPEPMGERIGVSVEQVLVWNPDVIITKFAEDRDEILSNPQWQEINAVKNNRVYAQLRYEKLDGVESIMGLVWTAVTLYPEQVSFDFINETRTFYSNLYLNDEVTDEQILEVWKKNI